MDADTIDPDAKFRAASEVLEQIFKLLDRMPEPARGRLKQHLNGLKEFIVDNRPPRFMIVGRRGAGKSSLINAMFQEKVAEIGSVLSQTGKAKWFRFQNKLGEMHILDTRGLGDATRPDTAESDDAFDDVISEVKGRCPDAVLFLCRAKDVDSHIMEDVKNVKAVRKHIKQVHNYDAPLIAVATQVDELDPKRVEPPFEDSVKQENIRQAVGQLRQKLVDHDLTPSEVIPICAYAEYDDRATTYQQYWQIDVLINYLLEHIKKDGQLQLARLSKLKSAQISAARYVTGATATACGGIAAIPIPVADILPITSLQIVMITTIGYLGGRELSKKAAAEFMSALGVNVGAAFVLREAARALAKWLWPGGGSVISAAVAAAGTWGLGEAAIGYFIRELPIEEVKRIFKRVKKEKETEKSEEEIEVSESH